ncbi:MAG TPA: DUF3618 domain-containing protein [Gemmatimonadales bacterium]
MAETTADVRRDIELTRERMSHTIAELEGKLNVMQTVRDHPWPAIGVAAAAGFLLAGSGADNRAAHAVSAAAVATKSRGSRFGPMLDDLLGRVLMGVQDVLEQKADELVGDLRNALGAPEQRGHEQRGHEPRTHERSYRVAEAHPVAELHPRDGTTPPHGDPYLATVGAANRAD